MSPTTAISPAGSSGWSQGTTVTAAPRLHRHRIWLFFRPQSRAVTRRDPPGLNTRGACGRGSGWPGLLPGPASRSEGLHSPLHCPQPLRPLPHLQRHLLHQVLLVGVLKAEAPLGDPVWHQLPQQCPLLADPLCQCPGVHSCKWAVRKSHGPSPPQQDPAPRQHRHPQMPTQGPTPGGQISTETSLVQSPQTHSPHRPPSSAVSPVPPSSPGMFCSFSHWSREQDALQWLGVSEHSPTTSAATWILLDSNHCGDRG